MFKVCEIIGISKIEFFNFSVLKGLRKAVPLNFQESEKKKGKSHFASQNSKRRGVSRKSMNIFYPNFFMTCKHLLMSYNQKTIYMWHYWRTGGVVTVIGGLAKLIIRTLFQANLL